jgi:serine/threonine-protein kinase PknK
LSRAVAIAAGSQVFVYGGFTSTGTTTAEILRFDPATGKVGAVGALAVPVHDAAGVALGGEALIIGGGNKHPLSIVQRVDASGVSRVIGNLPAPRADLSVASVGTSALIIGGGASGVLDRPILATDDGVHFRQVATLLLGVRYAAVAAAGGMVYVIGGVGAAGDRAEIQRIDPVTGDVTVIGRMPQPVSHASAINIAGRLLVIGGRRSGDAQDAIWEVDLQTGATRLIGRLPQPVSDFATAVIDQTGYLIGGETDTQVRSIVSITVP